MRARSIPHLEAHAMIPSEEIEITLAFAEKGHDVKIPAKRVVELLRVYRAWAEAPERVIDGKRVKLLEVSDE
jgi:hypothetical protein